MVQSVELLLDDAGDAAVRSDWEVLEALGLRTPARHRSAVTRPHITLAVAERIPDDVERAVTDLRPALPLPLVLGGLLIFGSRRMVLARAVVPSRALLDLQRATAAVMDGTGEMQDTMRPDRWTPHVTLARSVDPAGLARVGRGVARPARHDGRGRSTPLGRRAPLRVDHRRTLLARNPRRVGTTRRRPEKILAEPLAPDRLRRIQIPCTATSETDRRGNPTAPDERMRCTG